MTKHWSLFIARKEAGHSQSYVAKKLSITKERYSLKELNKAHFSLPEAQILAELYDMTLDELFNEKIKVK